ncbi:TPA: hypothetical protein UMF72_000538 [Stenotrophomonas maltophilia]|nr:hypothetical protein [Stenotrophomonas maltophilia]
MKQRFGTELRPALRSQYALRIAVIPERYGTVMSPCASIRLHAFTERFAADVRYLMPEEIAAFKPHAILWNRGAIEDADRIEQMAVLARRIGARLIYDIDDNLLAMDEHPERDAYAKLISAVRASIDVADEVWCSTEILASEIRSAGGNAVLMPNALDPDLWGAPRMPVQPMPKLKLVYMGTRTHDEDYAFLQRVLGRLQASRPGSFSLTLIGVNAASVALPDWVDVQSPPAHVGASYPAFVRWFVGQGPFDLGLAPLMATTFNRAKSGIKVLDYAAIGVPTLASDVPAYSAGAAGDCLLVENDEAAWLDVLQQVVDSRAILEPIRQRIQHCVGEGHFAEAVERRWLRITA